MRSSSKAIGAHIRRLRIQNKMTQDELAESVFVTRQTISNYETGRSNPDIDMLLKIAEVLKTDLNSLLYGEQLSAPKQDSQKRLRYSLIVFVSLAILTMILYPFTHFLKIRDWIIAPHLLVRLLFVPLLMFAAGWTMIQVIDYTIGINRRKIRMEKYLRIITYGILLTNMAMVLPYVGWLFVLMCRELSNATSIHMTFPYIPLYQETAYFFMELMYRFPTVYLLLGIFMGVYIF